MTRHFLILAVGALGAACLRGGLLDELAAADRAADAAVAAIQTPADLRAKQTAWKAWWNEAMGGLPTVRTPLNARVTGVVRGTGFRAEKIVFESQTGVYVTGLLYLPDDPKFTPPYPGLLVVHGHAQEGKLCDGYRRMALLAVRAGFGVFAPDPLSQGERRQGRPQDNRDCALEHASLGARSWLVGWNFARFRLWDAVRAIDYMASRPELDLSRLAVCGNSGGGTMSAYLQAFDERIRVAVPNSYVSSLREVFRARGAHDAEQFFFGQLRDGFNHAALLALGQPRVDLLVGAREADYFPFAGTRDTFACVRDLHARLGFANRLALYSCPGPHGWAESSRQAARAWIAFCAKGETTPFCGRRGGTFVFDAAALRKIPGNFTFGCDRLPFPPEQGRVTPTGQVRDLPGFRSLYALIADEAERLRVVRAANAAVRTPETLRAVVRRRAGIRPLEQILATPPDAPFDHAFNWWYLKGPWGMRRENETAMRATLGRSVVGRDAERLILKAARSGAPTVLQARGWDCIAAAHAYAAEPRLFDGIELIDPPPSWTDLVTNPDPEHDSYAVGVWGALRDYDWTELVPDSAFPAGVPTVTTTGTALPNQGVGLLVDGKVNPACALKWEKKPIEVTVDFGVAREIGGVRLVSGRSYTNRGVKKASFHADGRPLAEHVALRPAHTYKDNVVTWPPVRARRVTMVIEDTYDQANHYYSFYTFEAQKHIQQLFETPAYKIRAAGPQTVQIAELAFFGKTPPPDLPLPNKDGTVAYPDSRLVRDWQYQDAAVSNVSHCANVEADTTKPDPLGRDLDLRLTADGSFAAPDSVWRAAREKARRAFLARFRTRCDQFLYVKHIVMGNSIMHATDDLTDASYQEWRGVPDYRGGSQLLRATINPDGTVSQEVLLDEPNGIIRDPAVSFDAKTVVFAKRRNLETDDYHLWKLDLETRALTQLTSNEWVRAGAVTGLTNDVELATSDIEPCWLPDGTLVFQSTRCSHSVDCWPLPVSNLYRCEADGSRVRRIGFDQVQTFYPQLMDDGRVSYTRWEYNDRSASGLQQLYAMNPDGTKQTGLFANNSEFPFSLMHTRGIPGTRDIMMISCGHHVAQKGRLARSRLADGDDYANSTYDPARSVWGMNTNAVVMTFPGNRTMTIPWSPWDNPCGPAVTNMPGMYYVAGAAMNAAPGVQPTRMPHDYHYNVFDMHTQFGPQWAYPFPLGETVEGTGEAGLPRTPTGGLFLVSFMPEGCSFYRGPYSSRFGVYAMDEVGRRELLAFDWGDHCLQPVALKRRTPPPRQVPPLDYAQGFGTYYVQNVYAGAAMKGAPKGYVKKLRVVGLEYRPVHIGWNWQYGWHSTQGKIGTPIAVGNGAYDVKHVLGEADVEADGSCSVKVPARTPVYFQLVDAEGCAVQTMRSWSTLQPGEVNGCIGCHEHPHQAASDAASATALRRPPQDLQPALPGAPRHPFVVALEKEGPLASLDTWMGLNRPKPPDAGVRGDGFGFAKDIQPILDRRCVSCHGEGKRIDLRAVPAQLPPSDDQSHRVYTAAYLALSEKGKCTENVNFAHGLGFAPFKPPRSFGAVRSRWYRMLREGHGGRVKLTDAELRAFALWIDLAVPFCSAYPEAHAWSAWHRQRYLYTVNKRSAFHWLELNDIRREKGLAPVPLTGFEPNVAMPRRQRTWFE